MRDWFPGLKSRPSCCLYSSFSTSMQHETPHHCILIAGGKGGSLPKSRRPYATSNCMYVEPSAEYSVVVQQTLIRPEFSFLGVPHRFDQRGSARFPSHVSPPYLPPLAIRLPLLKNPLNDYHVLEVMCVLLSTKVYACVCPKKTSCA